MERGGPEEGRSEMGAGEVREAGAKEIADRKEER